MAINLGSVNHLANKRVCDTGQGSYLFPGAIREVGKDAHMRKDVHLHEGEIGFVLGDGRVRSLLNWIRASEQTKWRVVGILQVDASSSGQVSVQTCGTARITNTSAYTILPGEFVSVVLPGREYTSSRVVLSTVPGLEGQLIGVSMGTALPGNEFLIRITFGRGAQMDNWIHDIMKGPEPLDSYVDQTDPLLETDTHPETEFMSRALHSSFTKKGEIPSPDFTGPHPDDKVRANLLGEELEREAVTETHLELVNENAPSVPEPVIPTRIFSGRAPVPDKRSPNYWHVYGLEKTRVDEALYVLEGKGYQMTCQPSTSSASAHMYLVQARDAQTKYIRGASMAEIPSWHWYEKAFHYLMFIDSHVLSKGAVELRSSRDKRNVQDIATLNVLAPVFLLQFVSDPTGMMECLNLLAPDDAHSSEPRATVSMFALLIAYAMSVNLTIHGDPSQFSRVTHASWILTTGLERAYMATRILDLQSFSSGPHLVKFETQTRKSFFAYDPAPKRNPKGVFKWAHANKMNIYTVTSVDNTYTGFEFQKESAPGDGSFTCFWREEAGTRYLAACLTLLALLDQIWGNPTQETVSSLDESVEFLTMDESAIILHVLDDSLLDFLMGSAQAGGDHSDICIEEILHARVHTSLERTSDDVLQRSDDLMRSKFASSTAKNVLLTQVPSEVYKRALDMALA